MAQTRFWRPSKGKFRLLVAAALAAIAFLGVAEVLLRPESAPQQMPTTSEPKTALFLDGFNGARYAGELAAFKKGYFPGGVAVVARPQDPDFVATVASQRAIGVTSGQKFLLAVWRGVPVTAFAASFLDTSVAIFALESSKLKRPSDLVGKRLGFSKGSEGEVVFDAMMAQLGLPRSQITKVADRSSFEALRARDVDAIVAPIDAQPDPSSAAYDKITVIQPQNYGIHVPGLVYFASNELVHDHPSQIADVLQGAIRGWRFVYADPAQTVAFLAEVDPQRLKPEQLSFELQQQRSLVLPTGGRIGEYDESRWRTLRDILIFAKLGEEGVPLSQAVSYRFLREVYHRSPALANTDAN